MGAKMNSEDIRFMLNHFERFCALVVRRTNLILSEHNYKHTSAESADFEIIKINNTEYIKVDCREDVQPYDIFTASFPTEFLFYDEEEFRLRIKLQKDEVKVTL